MKRKIKKAKSLKPRTLLEQISLLQSEYNCLTNDLSELRESVKNVRSEVGEHFCNYNRSAYDYKETVRKQFKDECLEIVNKYITNESNRMEQRLKCIEAMIRGSK